MVKRRFAPERGDIVWLDFNPVRGHEQGGKRPALVLSERSYNEKTGLILICPITSHVKGYEFEVPLPADCPVRGVILCDQVRNLDWHARRAKLVFRVPDNVAGKAGEFVSILAEGK